jgi:hypothetical protein
MSTDGTLIDDFLGGDPLCGTKALDELALQGAAGEEQLFSRPIQYKTVQVQRRWLRYVSRRESTLVPGSWSG